jgi:hypothetical protein
MIDNQYVINPILGTKAPDESRGFLHSKSEASLLARANGCKNRSAEGAGAFG